MTTQPTKIEYYERRGVSVYGADEGPGTAPHIAECHTTADAQLIVDALNEKLARELP